MKADVFNRLYKYTCNLGKLPGSKDRDLRAITPQPFHFAAVNRMLLSHLDLTHEEVRFELPLEHAASSDTPNWRQ